MSDLNFVSPFFIVANLQYSVDFYLNKLGFNLLYMGPEADPYFAMVGRGPVAIMLKGSGVPMPNHTRYNWARFDAHIAAADPDALFEEFLSAGVVFSKPIHDNSDGLRGFELKDADGYMLFFGRPIVP